MTQQHKLKIAGRHHVPDKCPSGCPYIETYRQYNVGDPCRTCPVFLCKTLAYEGEIINLLSPEKYPKVLARDWEKWFNGNMKGDAPGM